MSALPLSPDHFAHTLARKDFEFFLALVFHFLNPSANYSYGWYLSALAKVLEDVERGECRRLMITIPPRYLKSIATSVAFVAWVLGRNPAARIICASYGQELSSRHAQSFRKVVQSAWYAQVFPATAASILRNTESDFTTSQGGYRFTTALGGTVTGVGADIIIIDDLMKAQDAHSPEMRERARRFYDETLLSRLDEKSTGRIISIQQRLHEDDIVAHLAEKGGFEHLNLPAIAQEDEVIALTHDRVHQRRIGEALDPARESLEVLESIRAEAGSRMFEAQYQQNPCPPDSEYVRWEKIQFYDEVPDRNRLSRLVISWDTASSIEPRADYSVGTIWGYDGEAWLLLDIIRERLLYPDLLARVRLERDRWRADGVVIEKTNVGPALLEDLTRDMRGLSPGRPRANGRVRYEANCVVGKAERLMTEVERLYLGFAKLPRQASWLKDLRHELTAFPNARHDDQVDSISQFLNWAVGPAGRRMIGLAPERRAVPRQRPRHLVGCP